jgi:hypothetical protein
VRVGDTAGNPSSADVLRAGCDCARCQHQPGEGPPRLGFVWSTHPRSRHVAGSSSDAAHEHDMLLSSSIKATRLGGGRPSTIAKMRRQTERDAVDPEPRGRMARVVRSKAGASGLAVLVLSIAGALGCFGAHWSYSESFHARHGLSSKEGVPNSEQVQPLNHSLHMGGALACQRREGVYERLAGESDDHTPPSTVCCVCALTRTRVAADPSLTPERSAEAGGGNAAQGECGRHWGSPGIGCFWSLTRPLSTYSQTTSPRVDYGLYCVGSHASRRGSVTRVVHTGYVRGGRSEWAVG